MSCRKELKPHYNNIEIFNNTITNNVEMFSSIPLLALGGGFVVTQQNNDKKKKENQANISIDKMFE